MSKLYFKYGAMNSGKSTILIQTAYNYEETGKKVILIKPAKDLKAKDKVSSRIGVSRKVDYLLKEDDSLVKIAEDEKNVNCILIDEAQFLTKKQVDEASYIANVLDIPVLCYGLRTDFKGNGFPGSIRLLEIADKLEELKTICSTPGCSRKGTFNVRYVNGKITCKGSQVAIDGKDNVTYKSVCPKCFYELQSKKRLNKFAIL